jgi:hypothetical protein
VEALEKLKNQIAKNYNKSNTKSSTKLISYTILQIYEYNSSNKKELIYEKINKFVFNVNFENIEKDNGESKLIQFTIYATTYDEAVKKLEDDFLKYDDFICNLFNSTTMENLSYEIYEVVEYPFNDENESMKETEPVVKEPKKIPTRKSDEDTYEFLIEMLIQSTDENDPYLMKKTINDDKLFAKTKTKIIIYAKSNRQAFSKLKTKIESSYNVLAKKFKFATTLDVKVIEAVKYDGITGRMDVIDPDEDEND